MVEGTRDKRLKGDTNEEESKATEQNPTATTTTTNNNNNNSSSINNRETSADSSKENSKVSEVQKPDYIHVRARRGQATDSHSLAERVSSKILSWKESLFLSWVIVNTQYTIQKQIKRFILKYLCMILRFPLIFPHSYANS